MKEQGLLLLQAMVDLRAVHAFATGEERAQRRQWVEAKEGMPGDAFRVLVKIAPAFRRARGVCQLLAEGRSKSKGSLASKGTPGWEHLPDGSRWFSMMRR